MQFFENWGITVFVCIIGSIYLFRYEEIAENLAVQIRSGNLKQGDRCPSTRQICKQFKVSLATSVQALNILERQGLVEARPQSGYYVRAAVPSSALLKRADTAPAKIITTQIITGPMVDECVAASRDPSLAPLGAATPSATLMPVKALMRSFSLTARELGPDAMLYELPAGNEDLRRQIARRMAQTGYEAVAEDIIITNGGMEAISIALRTTTKPGDIVAIEVPIYFGILELIENLGLKVAPIPNYPSTGIDLDALTNVVKQKKIAAIVGIPNFNNPVGGMMPNEAKKQLAELASAADIPFIEDDLYGDLYHHGTRPLAVKSFDRTGNVIYCSSFSKTLSPGIRLGWAIPGKYHKEYQKRKSINTLSSPTWSQSAVANYLNGNGFDRHLEQFRRKLIEQVHHYIHAILQSFPEGTKVAAPLGGFVLWVQLPAGLDSQKVWAEARANKISIIPGFAFSAAGDQFRNFIRISCGYPLNPVMERAIKKLGSLTGKLMPTT